MLFQQGTVTSTADPLPGHQMHQLAMILPPKGDGTTVYSGTLTFTATEKVEVVVLHEMNLKANETIDAKKFGGILSAPLPPSNKTTVAILLITPDYGTTPIPSTSIPFAGSAIALHTLSGEPFAASYTVSYQTGKANMVDSILPTTTTTGANMTSTTTTGMMSNATSSSNATTSAGSSTNNMTMTGTGQ